MRTRILKLRKRLRSIGIGDMVRPSATSHSLPTESQRLQVEKQFSLLEHDVAQLPLSFPGDDVVDTELRSLRSEIEASRDMMQRINRLVSYSSAAEACDNALSDFLEHIDSFPSVPIGPLSTSHTSNPTRSPEQQLSARLAFTQQLVDVFRECFSSVADDGRARSEQERVLQTWTELQAMGMDLVQGKKSRPASALSSTPSGSSRPASVASGVQRSHKKLAGYANLSVGSPSQFLSPPIAHGRRAASGGTPSSSAPKHPRGTGVHARSSSRASLGSNRSVSGPGPVDTPSRLHNSTFASRQRTSSVSSTTSGTPSKVERPVPTTSRVRAQTTQSQASRTASPAFSDASSMYSRSSMNLSRTSMRSSWARAPRQSFPTLPRSPPRARQPVVRKPYIANPKNKLDVAVGDVVNKLPSNVDINVEVVADTWKDQSGKYWIGSQDPKLCFCRILRSQTVMVRVGGGWSELSKRVASLLIS